MTLTIHRCSAGHATVVDHPRCRYCGGAFAETIDIEDPEGEIVTWTVSTATPPGVRAPNPLAIVEFDIDGQSVRVIGQTTTEELRTGMSVKLVAVDRLRDPADAIREQSSQRWDGYRFQPIE